MPPKHRGEASSHNKDAGTTQKVAGRDRKMHPASIRNTLALVCSSDLKKWTLRGIVLQHPDVRKHAFQYVDWLFDGRDIVLLSRTAFGDGADAARSAHDANYLTFHRIEDFRNFKNDVPEQSGAGRD